MEPRIGEPRLNEPVRRDRRTLLTPHLIFGLLIIAVGVLFTLDNLGLAEARRYLRWWPTALILVGLAKFWQARGGLGSPIAGVFFILVGSWLQLDNLGVIDRDLWDFWPLLLVFVGGMIIFQGVRGRQIRGDAGSVDVISGVAIMGGVKRSTASQAFRGGELTAVMGGCEIDLRHAAINGDAVFDVFAMWGGIEIRVPESWTVIIRATPIMGAIEDQTRPVAAAGAHRLTVRGFVLMGGVEIKN